MTKQKGFTFVELVIVMAILMVMTAIAMPYLSEVRSNYRVVHAINNIQTDMAWAKAQAVSNNNNYVMTFGANGSDLSNNTYAIYNDSDNNFSCATGVQIFELVKTVEIPVIYDNIVFGYVAGIKKTDNLTNLTGDPVTFTGGATCPKWVSFRPTGLPNSTGSIYIAPQEDLTAGNKTRMKAITITNAGRIKVWNYKNNAWE